MALTRKMLKAMSIEETAIEQIIEAHTETVDALKAQRDSFKAETDKVAELEKQIAEMENGGDWEERYNNEHKAFEDFKNAVAGEKANEEKKALYKKLLSEQNVDEKAIDSILRVTDFEKISVSDGKLTDCESLVESIKSDWNGFILEIGGKGNPPEPNPAGGNTAKEDFEKMSLAEQMKFANEHPTEYANFTK